MITSAITEKQFLRDFSKEIGSGNAAVFAGAGLSMSSGYVDWKALLKEVVEDLGLNLKKEHDLVSVAQYYVNESKSKNRLVKTIIEKLGEAKKPNDAHKTLAKLPIGTYWTTNYDNLIEAGLKEQGKESDVISHEEQFKNSIPNGVATVYKMHGDIKHPDDAVITKDDYENYPFTHAQFITALKHDFVRKTFLFIGFSFNDPNVDNILGSVRALLKGSTGEHYNIAVKPIKGKQSDDEYKYSLLKQEYFIRDLRRCNILTVLLDDYSEIPLLLEKIEQRYRRKSVFISGAAANYGDWNTHEAEAFCSKLSSLLVQSKKRIVTGFGVGVGSSVINGSLEALEKRGEELSEKTILMRPFPQNIADAEVRNLAWQKYRKNMLRYTGIAIFLFGNKTDPKNKEKVIDSDGVIKEFELAFDDGVVVIPVGATGFVAEQLWTTVNKDLDKYYPFRDSRFEKHFQTIGDSSKTTDDILEALYSMVDFLQNN